MRIEINGLGKIFETRSNERVTALENVSTVVEPGQFVALLGPSGCGKSTLLDIVSGLLSPTSGSVLIDGKKPGSDGARPGLVFQAPVLLPWRTALENVCLPGEVGTRSDRTGRAETGDLRNRAMDLLKLVNLKGFENKLPSELSGGMQQRVALARALLLDSSLLCMDEPFSALDEFTREQIHMELLRIWRERSFTGLFVTHNVFEAVFLADRVLVMTPRPGRIVADVEVSLPRPRNLDMIGSDHFAADVRSVRSAMSEHWVEQDAPQAEGVDA